MIRPRLCISKYPVLAKNDILDSWLIACCKRPPTLARQIWRHNGVIGRNKYLISTLSETTFPWVYSLQFLFKSTRRSWRYERKGEWVFFSEHSVVYAVLSAEDVTWIQSLKQCGARRKIASAQREKVWDSESRIICVNKLQKVVTISEPESLRLNFYLIKHLTIFH